MNTDGNTEHQAWAERQTHKKAANRATHVRGALHFILAAALLAVVIYTMVIFFMYGGLSGYLPAGLAFLIWVNFTWPPHPCKIGAFTRLADLIPGRDGRPEVSPRHLDYARQKFKLLAEDLPDIDRKGNDILYAGVQFHKQIRRRMLWAALAFVIYSVPVLFVGAILSVSVNLVLFYILTRLYLGWTLRGYMNYNLILSRAIREEVGEAVQI